MTWIPLRSKSSNFTLLLWRSSNRWQRPQSQHQKLRLHSCPPHLQATSRWPVATNIRPNATAIGSRVPVVLSKAKPLASPVSIKASYSTIPPASSSSSSSSRSDAPTANESQPPEHLDDKERHIYQKLSSELSPSRLEVQDVSGGCGSMYAIEIVSSKFKGLSMIKQHRLVQEILQSEISGWHGVQLRTKPE